MRSKRVRLGLFLLIVLVLIPFITKGVQTLRLSIWDGKNHINIAVDNGDIHVWSIEPSESHVVQFIIPANTYLSVSSYGSYRVEAIGKLSLLEKKNERLFVRAIKESLGVPVDGVVIRKDGRKDTFDLARAFGLAGIGDIVFAGQFSAFTNLTMYDVLRLWMLSFYLKKEAIERVNLASLTSVSKITLPDNSLGLTLDTARFSTIAQKYFADRRIADEHLTVEVINATGTVGEANTIALLVGNIGGNVINTSKSEKREDKTMVFAKIASYTAEKIARITGGSLIREAPKEGRADILVVLGGE